MKKKKGAIRLTKSNIVGTIHTAGGLLRAHTAKVDVAELRLDLLPQLPKPTEVDSLPVPILLTVRRKDEGGGRAWNDSRRAALYLEYMEVVQAIDIEGRSIRGLGGLVEEAKRRRKIVVASFHDFATTPTAARMRGMEKSARAAGADVVKFATVTNDTGSIGRLLQVLEKATGPVSVMGMGSLGRASRLLFAKAGSVLNYGWLDQPQIPGQWGAEEFRELVSRA